MIIEKSVIAGERCSWHFTQFKNPVLRRLLFANKYVQVKKTVGSDGGVESLWQLLPQSQPLRNESVLVAFNEEDLAKMTTEGY